MIEAFIIHKNLEYIILLLPLSDYRGNGDFSRQILDSEISGRARVM